MKYTLYKITNTINGKIYVGVHKTYDINDAYLGSGKVLKRAIEKYGYENFHKEILEVYDNSDDMFAAEAILVNEEFVADKETYNIKLGGYGGFDWINGNINLSERDTKPHIARSVYFDKLKNDPKYRESQLPRLKLLSELGIEARKILYPEGIWKGKRHNQDSKDKIGKANSIHQSGKGNSQYGTRWIHSLEEKKSKRINKEELLPEGWLEGRKIKF